MSELPTVGWLKIGGKRVKCWKVVHLHQTVWCVADLSRYVYMRLDDILIRVLVDVAEARDVNCPGSVRGHVAEWEGVV